MENKETSGKNEELYRKFLESKQEKLRLKIALEEFSEADGKKKTVYGDYLKRRIRPAMEMLISRGDVDKIETLAGYGWITESLLEEFIRKAFRQENRAVILCLLHLKNRMYGFKDKEFLL